MLHLNNRETNSMMEASNNNINNERESIINMTQEFRGFLSKIELEYNQVKSELIQVKKEIKEMKENEVFKNQKKKKKCIIYTINEMSINKNRFNIFYICNNRFIISRLCNAIYFSFIRRCNRWF